MEKSLTCPLLLLYALIYLFSCFFSIAFLFFPVLCVLQLYLRTYTPTPVSHVILKAKAESVLNGNLFPSQFNSPVSSLYCIVQRVYRIPYTFGKATKATNGFSTKDDANHTTK